MENCIEIANILNGNKYRFASSKCVYNCMKHQSNLSRPQDITVVPGSLTATPFVK